MQLILREDVQFLGRIGDLVQVKSGYARNFLLPRRLAVAANERQVRRVEHERRVIEARVVKLRNSAEDIAKKLDGLVLTVTKAAGESDKLFGSVTTMEIEALLRAKGFDIERRQLEVAETIKTLGEHAVGVELHRDVIAMVMVNVLREEA